MWLLVTTLCLAVGPDAECRKSARYVHGDLSDCKAVAQAEMRYLAETSARVSVLHLSTQCRKGRDT